MKWFYFEKKLTVITIKLKPIGRVVNFYHFNMKFIWKYNIFMNWIDSFLHFVVNNHPPKYLWQRKQVSQHCRSSNRLKNVHWDNFSTIFNALITKSAFSSTNFIENLSWRIAVWVMSVQCMIPVTLTWLTSLPFSVFLWDPMVGNNVHFPIELAFVRSSRSQIIDLFSFAAAPAIMSIYRDVERLWIAVKLGNERN